MSPDLLWLATTGLDGMLHLYRLADGKLIKDIKLCKRFDNESRMLLRTAWNISSHLLALSGDKLLKVAKVPELDISEYEINFES